MEVLPYLRELNLCSMCLRILLAMFVGGFLGLDREQKHRPAGFRTYMLVAVGAAATTILSQYLNLMLDTRWLAAYQIMGNRTDVVRLGTQVISGTGFLAAGTILVTGKQEVKGLTTAAGLWASACMGLACGAGFLECVVVSFLLVVLCMRVFPSIQTAILNRSRNMIVYLETENILQLSSVVNFIKREDIRVYSLEIDKETPEHMDCIAAIIDMRLPMQLYHAELIAALSTLDGVISIDEV